MIEFRFVPIDRWPGKQTVYHQNAKFKTAYNKTLALLKSELQKIDGREIVIQAYFEEHEIRNDGWPRAGSKPKTPGVVVSFKKPQGESFMKDGKRMVNVVPVSFPCDTYFYMEHNLHAIALSLAALRAVDRYGVTKGGEQYQGWKQIEAPVNGFASKEEAGEFIATHSGAPSSYTLMNDKVFREQAYRVAARKLHPDAPTGNHELFVKLQQALAILETT